MCLVVSYVISDEWGKWIDWVKLSVTGYVISDVKRLMIDMISHKYYNLILIWWLVIKVISRCELISDEW